MKNKAAVKLPKSVICMATLANRNGKTDRKFLRMMASAIDESNRHRNANLRKVSREPADD